MASRRISIVMENQVIELERQGFKIRKIAKVLGLSRNTVRAILRSDHQQLAPEVSAPSSQTMDWQKIHDEFHRGVACTS